MCIYAVARLLSSNFTPEEWRRESRECDHEQFQETAAFLRVVRQTLAHQGVANLEAVELGLREVLEGRQIQRLVTLVALEVATQLEQVFQQPAW